MLLYHYSKAPYEYLKTTLAQGIHSPKDKELIEKRLENDNDLDYYYNHISLYFEPLPYAIIGDLYEPYSHKNWFNGNEFYEHVIDSKTIPNLKWAIYETPLHRKFQDDHWDDCIKQPNGRSLYMYMKAEMEDKNKLRGAGNEGFERAAKPYTTGIADAYRRSVELNKNEPEVLTKYYAPDVPHCFLYVPSGSVRVLYKPKLITIGESD